MLPSLLLSIPFLFATLFVAAAAAADCTSFLPSGGVPIIELRRMSEPPVASFDIASSFASFAGQSFELREETPPTVTTHRYVWGSCEKGGMARDGTVEAGEQCPEDTLLCRTTSITRPSHRLEPSLITSVIPILSLPHPLDANHPSSGYLMPYRAGNRSDGWTHGWEPKGWKEIEVELVGETYAKRVQAVILLHRCVEGEDSTLAFLTTFSSIHVFTVTGKDGCVDWAREKKQEGGGGGGGEGAGAQPIEEQPSQRPDIFERARGTIWWISGFGFILLASILLLLIHCGRVPGMHNIFRRRIPSAFDVNAQSFHPFSLSSPRQRKFPRVHYINTMFDADQAEAAAAGGKRGPGEGPSQRTPLLG